MVDYLFCSQVILQLNSPGPSSLWPSLGFLLNACTMALPSPGPVAQLMSTYMI